MAPVQELVISADSHVVEDPHLWEQRLPEALRDRAPVFPERGIGQQFQAHPGGFDPRARVEEMAVDGVSGEVLYPSSAMNLFSLEPALQEACFRVYNDWILEYCSASPERLFGIAMLCCHDIDAAVAELERCREGGLVGAMVWEVPPPELSFLSAHYEPLWAAAEDLAMPISIHSLTGVPYVWPRQRMDRVPLATSFRHANEVVTETANALADLIACGALARHPGLRLVIVESEASWIPAYLARYDHYYRRSHGEEQLPLLPSEYFDRQVYATFFNDRALAGVLSVWGGSNLMWSNDYPHPNSTWPNSRQVIARDLGHLPEATQAALLAGTVTALYSLPALVPVAG